MDLPQASPLVVYTLESPWFVAALLLLAGATLWIGLRYRAPRAALRGGAGLMLAAIALIALARMIETTGERLARETRSLVETALRGDAEGVADLLEDDLVLIVGHERTNWGKADIVARVRAIREFVASNNIREVRGAGTSKSLGVSVLAQTTTTSMSLPAPNQWRFEWRRGSDGRWRVSTMTWEQWGFDEEPSAAMLRP